MDSIEYQVTIKSANQKVDDYVTKCRSCWSVLQLKQHISETHINRPNIEDQRLIYAGNLLKDNQTLKQIFFRDSLCTELTNSNKTDFTIHLVCSQKSNHNVYNTSQPTSNNNRSPSNRPTSSAQQNSGLDQNNGSVNPIAGSINSISNNNVNNNNNNNASYVNNRSNQANVVSGIQVAQNLPTTQTTNLNANQVNDIVANLMDSEQMRHQMNMFQELANSVAAQLINNLASTLTRTSLSSSQSISTITTSQSSTQHASSRQQIPEPDISSIMNNIARTIHVATPATVTIDPRIGATAATQMINAGNGIQTHLVDASDHGNNPNRNLNHPADNADAAPGVGEQQGGIRFRLGHQPAHQAAPMANQPVAAAAQIPAPQVPDPEVHAMQHDVIDWVYYSIRALVLMAALYIHASILRLLFIFGVLAIAYFFNRRSARRNDRARRADQRQQQQNAWHEQPQQPNDALRNAVARVPGEAPVAGARLNAANVADGNRSNNNQAINNNNNNERQEFDEGGYLMPGEGAAHVGQQQARLPFLKFCYLVITDFLASLVPE